MTTKSLYRQTVYCGLVAILSCLYVIAPALAQEESFGQDAALPNESPALNNNEVATSSFVMSDIEAVETTEPWFRVEKLTGENLAVGDFVVGPGRIELEVKPGETITTEISVANRISDDRTFEITVEDAAGSPDASRAVVLLGAERGPHTIKDYISSREQTFTLDLGERARIPVTVSIPPDAEPGGFYGSVLISTVQVDTTESSNSTRSPIIARVGTLFFVTVPGEVTRAGETKELTLLNKKWWYEKGPIELAILYENTGSVHLNPYGELRIKNLFGEEVGFLELEPWFVLPESLRTREVTWDRELLFGRYTATTLINRGYDDVIDERSVVFWVLPWRAMGGIFVVVFIILFGLRLFFRTFEFKRK
jgi:hypothetical protein